MKFEWQNQRVTLKGYLSLSKVGMSMKTLCKTMREGGQAYLMEMEAEGESSAKWVKNVELIRLLEVFESIYTPLGRLPHKGQGTMILD